MHAQEKYEDFLTHLPVTASDRVLMALKGHLLVEQALREFVYKRVHRSSRIQDKQIPFAIILDFAASLEYADNMNWVWEAAKKLNRLRNLLAHNLSPLRIEELEKEFISYVRMHDGELSVLVNDKPLDYGGFALAMFQVYDAIITREYVTPADLKAAEARGLLSDERISRAINKAFLTVEEGKVYAGSQGPKPRKKWPQTK